MEQYLNHEINISNAKEILKAFDNTDVCVFMYYPQTKIITIPKKTCKAYQCAPVYTDMPYGFADAVVHQDDYEAFNEMYFGIDRGEKTSSSVFHSKDLNYCWKVTLTTIGYSDDGKPEETFGIIENTTDAYKSNLLVEQIKNQIANGDEKETYVQEAMSLIATSISGLYFALYHIWLEDYTFICFQEKNSEYMVSTDKKQLCNKKLWDFCVKEYVEPEYQKSMSRFVELETLAERLHDVNSISLVYRRKGTGWTKGQFIVAKRDENGNVTNVIFIISDINAEREREEQQEQAIYEAQHDPLTGAYNRKGFEIITEAGELQHTKLGLAMVDIDNFKTLNDGYGHDTGDQVIVAVAEQLKNSFRNVDKVFRLGGDEFAVLLNNCDASAWNKICHNLKSIHTYLAEVFSYLSDVSITLSVGVCFSENGYSDRIMQMADKALYATKQSGRAGCTLIDQNQNVLRKWRDDNLSLCSQNVLEYNSTAVCRMEIPLDASKPKTIICGETMKILLGVPSETTPEECYRVWEEGIEDSYKEALKQVRGIMIEEGKAECTYLWRHPKWGNIFVRSGGYGEMKDGKEVLHVFITH